MDGNQQGPAGIPYDEYHLFILGEKVFWCHQGKGKNERRNKQGKKMLESGG
jgi:hypothetical protein